MSLNPITPQTVGQAVSAVSRPSAQSAAQQVGQTFKQALDSLSQSQNASDALIQKLAAGENVDLHQVMIASEQTDIRFRVALAMRDKLVEAYHEVMRMQV
jgi:flagellar hook-basal body complex protein FliE